MPSKIYRREELSNNDYHALQPEGHHYSSSQIKDAMVSVRKFWEMYIGQTVKRESSPAMDIGTFFHTAVLEPEFLYDECAIFTGDRKVGAPWKEFMAANQGKIILKKKEADLAFRLREGVTNSPIAQDLLSHGDAEVSFFTEFDGIRVKCRADWLHLSKVKSYLVDLKSCTGDVHDDIYIKKKIDTSNYDLSAALYIDIINKVIKDLKLDVKPLESFIWTFATKDYVAAKSYFADADLINVGREKYKHGLKNIMKGIGCDWQFPDTLDEIGATPWAKKDWLKPEATPSAKLYQSENLVDVNSNALSYL